MYLNGSLLDKQAEIMCQIINTNFEMTELVLPVNHVYLSSEKQEVFIFGPKTTHRYDFVSKALTTVNLDPDILIETFQCIRGTDQFISRLGDTRSDIVRVYNSDLSIIKTIPLPVMSSGLISLNSNLFVYHSQEKIWISQINTEKSISI